MTPTAPPPTIGQTVSDLGVPLTGNERPKGYAPDYRPRPGSDRALYMDTAVAVISRYAEQGLRVPTRAIAYRVAADLGRGHEQIDNIEDAVVMLRRTGRVAMYAVSDGRSQWVKPWTADPDDAAKALARALAKLRGDRQDGQPWRVVLLAEAAGMVPVLSGLCDAYGVPLVSGSGSVPLSVVHTIAAEVADVWQDAGAATAVLFISDFDLKGLSGIFAPFARDVEAFAADLGAPDSVQVLRIAATAAQVREHVPENLRLPPPPRVPWWPAEFSLPAAEALIDVLPGIVRAAFDHYLPDAEQRAAVIATEPEAQREAAQQLITRLTASDEEQES